MQAANEKEKIMESRSGKNELERHSHGKKKVKAKRNKILPRDRREWRQIVCVSCGREDCIGECAVRELEQRKEQYEE